MSLLLCVYVGVSPRQAAKAVKVVAFMFNGMLGKAPCHTTIRTWLAKMGIDTMKHKNIDIKQAYALILDASISVNDQPMHLQETTMQPSGFLMKRKASDIVQNTRLL